MSAGGLDRFGHVLDDVILCLAALELSVNHLVGRGDGEVEVLDIGHALEGRLHIIDDGPDPPAQA
jgi:hypothetical protein